MFFKLQKLSRSVCFGSKFPFWCTDSQLAPVPTSSVSTTYDYVATAAVCIRTHHLQAVLVSRLQDRDAGSQASNSLMKAVLVCDRFLTGAQGTQAELEVLKDEVKLVLARTVCCLSIVHVCL